MNNFHISFLEHNDVQESARVLSFAMLNNPMHIAVFGGNGEIERLQIEKMFLELFYKKLGIVFVARQGKKIVGVMRMNSCIGEQSKGESEELRGEINMGPLAPIG